MLEIYHALSKYGKDMLSDVMIEIFLARLDQIILRLFIDIITSDMIVS